MWEIFTDGEIPYVGVIDINEFLTEGKRLEQPKQCDDSLWKLMQKCWNADRQQRLKAKMF
jgi:hypothetical protein